METSRNSARTCPIEEQDHELQDHQLKEAALSRANVIAILVIVLVLAGGAVALHRLDNGQGTRTSRADSARTASD